MSKNWSKEDIAIIREALKETQDEQVLISLLEQLKEGNVSINDEKAKLKANLDKAVKYMNGEEVL